MSESSPVLHEALHDVLHDALPDALHEAARDGAAVRAWAAMRAFVEDNSGHAQLRERLGLGLGVGRVKALLLLKEGPLTMTQIAEAHHVDAPYATIIVDKLEGLGLVERTPHPDDRRRRRVALTAAGHDAVLVAERALSAPPPALATLSGGDLTRLEALLQRLTRPPCPTPAPTLEDPCPPTARP